MAEGQSGADRQARSASADHAAGAWLTPADSCRANIRWWAACSSIASGCSISAAASSARRPISATWANGRHIPNFLDWLADEFASNGWDLKRLQRLIVTSTAYRQSSARTPERDAADPDNLLLSRMNVRRLDAEIIRDSVLAASGSAFGRMFGPPFR